MTPNLKSAEELSKIVYSDISDDFNKLRMSARWQLTEHIEQIQLNAYKAGMTEELGMIEKEQMKHSENTEIYQALQRVSNAILSARDRKESL